MYGGGSRETYALDALNSNEYAPNVLAVNVVCAMTARDIPVDKIHM